MYVCKLSVCLLVCVSVLLIRAATEITVFREASRKRVRKRASERARHLQGKQAGPPGCSSARCAASPAADVSWSRACGEERRHWSSEGGRERGWRGVGGQAEMSQKVNYPIGFQCLKTKRPSRKRRISRAQGSNVGSDEKKISFIHFVVHLWFSCKKHPSQQSVGQQRWQQQERLWICAVRPQAAYTAAG